jgi:hypothetical protein
MGVDVFKSAVTLGGDATAVSGATVGVYLFRNTRA